MAAPWLAVVLRNVPWGEVIRRAPEIADGARKLWQNVSGKQQEAPVAYEQADPTPYMDDDDKAARIHALEKRVAELRGQMVETSQLIKSMADQNAQLVVNIEDNRRRITRLQRIVVVLLIAILVVGWKLWQLN